MKARPAALLFLLLLALAGTAAAPPRPPSKAVWPTYVLQVIAYNTKDYYVVVDGGDEGEQIYSFPITGNETVLDAVAQLGGVRAVPPRSRIHVVRTVLLGDRVLPVDWAGVVERGQASTNYVLCPGDRVYVRPQPPASREQE